MARAGPGECDWLLATAVRVASYLCNAENALIRELIGTTSCYHQNQSSRLIKLRRKKCIEYYEHLLLKIHIFGSDRIHVSWVFKSNAKQFFGALEMRCVLDPL